MYVHEYMHMYISVCLLTFERCFDFRGVCLHPRCGQMIMYTFDIPVSIGMREYVHIWPTCIKVICEYVHV